MGGSFDFKGGNELGRPKGSKKPATTKVNPDAKVGGIRAAEPPKEGFQCTCCAKIYKQQQSNFFKSKSPMFVGNNGYLPFCKHCLDTYFSQVTEYLGGNDYKAIERVCQLADWYYTDAIWESTLTGNTGFSRVAAYPARMQLRASVGTTYLDTIRDQVTNIVTDYDEFEEMYEQGKTGITKAQLSRWGTGFEETEYRELDSHYRSLCDIIDTSDVIQDNLAKDLCEIKIQQRRARNGNDAELFQKFTKLYQDTLKSANLRVKGSDTSMLSDSEACWGNFIRDVEKYAPADYYRDKKLYADVDDLIPYWTRQILRPMRNFLVGTREMDSEFSVEEDGSGTEKVGE